MKYDAQQIRNDADPEMIANALGLDTRRRGKQVSILCPVHDDKHFGSCFLTERGYKCFACGESGDVINLVQTVRQCSFMEACQFIIERIGGAEARYKSKSGHLPRVLDNRSLVIIGLAPSGNCKMPHLSSIVPEDAVDDAADVEWYTSMDTEGYCAIYETERTNALTLLLQKDEALYRQTIVEAAKDSLERYIELEKMLKFSSSDSKWSRAVRIAADSAGILELVSALRDAQRVCQDIIIEFGSEQPKQATSELTTPPLFGKISGVSL